MKMSVGEDLKVKDIIDALKDLGISFEGSTFTIDVVPSATDSSLSELVINKCEDIVPKPTKKIREINNYDNHST